MSDALRNPLLEHPEPGAPGSPAGSAWLAANPIQCSYLCQLHSKNVKSVLEKTSHAHYSDLLFGGNVPKSQKQKIQEQCEAWYWGTIKSEFDLIILLCSWYIILSSDELTSPCSVSERGGIVAILQMENGRCSWEAKVPRSQWPSWNWSQLLWFLSSLLLSEKRQLRRRVLGAKSQLPSGAQNYLCLSYHPETRRNQWIKPEGLHGGVQGQWGRRLKMRKVGT